ncbi:SDR family NAD(P)-dependent oxidoreductase [Paracoccus litorisediminis]|uniref:SDR family NAD(P)-dependent oxidoreductase n=1 Tax=Paracoccus litorisediminis TaxID=2006130 RepID=UPI00372F745B
MMKTMLITGASRGIGLAIAKRFSLSDSEFSTIVLVSRDAKRLEEAREEVRVLSNDKAVHAIVADLGQTGFQCQLFDEIEGLGLQVTSIVNNAGYTAPCKFDDIQDIELDLTLQINVKAPLLIVREARRRGHKLDHIVNIASTAGMNGRPKWATYSASKAAIRVASESMKEEFAPDGTDVLCISPGRCATDLRKTLAPDEDPTTIMQPEDVAEGIALMLSPAAKVLRHENNFVFR